MVNNNCYRPLFHFYPFTYAVTMLLLNNIALKWPRQLTSRSLAAIRLHSTAEKLHCRKLIRLAGAESGPFLQGLVTNDIAHLSQGAAQSIYALFLNKSGRIMYDSIVYRSENTNELFLECDENVAPELRKHLMVYRIRKKIAIDIVSDEYNLWTVFNQKEETDDFTGLEIHSADPRLKTLGHRIVTQLDDHAMLKRFGLAAVNNSNAEYKLNRYKLGVAEGIQEIVPGKAFPMEFNCDYMNGLSVHKGCYLGQEFTARTYHTGVVRKRIMPIKFETSPSLEIVNADVKTGDGKAAGKVRGVEGGSGIGLLRMDLVKDGKPLNAKGHPVTTWIPDWWPTDAAKSIQIPN